MFSSVLFCAGDYFSCQLPSLSMVSLSLHNLFCQGDLLCRALLSLSITFFVNAQSPLCRRPFLCLFCYMREQCVSFVFERMFFVSFVLCDRDESESIYFLYFIYLLCILRSRVNLNANCCLAYKSILCSKTLCRNNKGFARQRVCACACVEPPSGGLRVRAFYKEGGRRGSEALEFLSFVSRGTSPRA